MLAQLKRVKGMFIEICIDLRGDNSFACDVLAQLDQGASRNMSHAALTSGVTHACKNLWKMQDMHVTDREKYRVREVKKDAGNSNDCRRDFIGINTSNRESSKTE